MASGVSNSPRKISANFSGPKTAQYKVSYTMYLVFVFKCLNFEGPNFFHDYYSISYHPYATRRNGIDVTLPKVRTEVAKKGCFYLGAKQFNDLPFEVKLVSSLLIFKSKLGEIFI